MRSPFCCHSPLFHSKTCTAPDSLAVDCPSGQDRGVGQRRSYDGSETATVRPSSLSDTTLPKPPPSTHGETSQVGSTIVESPGSPRRTYEPAPSSASGSQSRTWTKPWPRAPTATVAPSALMDTEVPKPASDPASHSMVSRAPYAARQETMPVDVAVAMSGHPSPSTSPKAKPWKSATASAWRRDQARNFWFAVGSSMEKNSTPSAWPCATSTWPSPSTSTSATSTVA
mmetsp:Transcript_13953/g.47992  ORF Transcript_13953/g.47992 Transcript_13953/m.47992 type:complete len:228 (-) Transcript_13953:798-1481(-)